VKRVKRVRRFVPHLVVFTASMGVMILELVASRLVSKYFGSSLYSWTGIIGVVLGGISLGNYLGGRLADRHAPRRIVGALLLVASALTFLILGLDALLYRVVSRGSFAPVSAVMVWRSLALIVVLFLLPSAALGTISPVMAKYALEDNPRVGNTVGSIYAMSAIGSIVGTFLCGYLLIPLLGIPTIVILVGLLLAALALLMTLPRRRLPALVWLVATTAALAAALGGHGLTLLFPASAESTLLYARDTQYSHIEVRDVRRADAAQAAGAGAQRLERILVQDALVHNRYDPARPDELLYEYEEIFASLTEQALAAALGPQTLTLGAGGCVFPLYLERHYPGRHEVVEIDPEVLRVARRYFDLTPDSRLVQAAADARNYVQWLHGQAERRRFDLVYLDAFNSFSVPYHLTTREFVAMLADLLEPGGILLANCIDILDVGRFLNAYVNTLRQVFPDVAVFTDTEFQEQNRATFVVAAAFRPIPALELRDRQGQLVGRRLPEERLAELRARNGDGFLSDRYAPVENLMAPVFLRSVD
jgi:spermidine synthase